MIHRVFACIAICLSWVASSIAQDSAHPNIVLIVADDLGIYDLHCYGREDHRTPNLDRLASQGARFTTNYCGLPICSASRASLLTGKFPARLHLTTYLTGRPDADSQLVLQPHIEPALIPSSQTIAEVLQRNGYATGIFGKWHLGGGDSAPAKQGFDVVYEPSDSGKPDLVEGGKNEHAITSRAIEFIQSTSGKPYFCYVPHHAPHILLRASDELIEKNKNAWNPPYAALIESLDTSVGRLLDAIEKSPEAANTIVIFTSDNGGLHVPEGHPTPATHNGPFRAGKGYLYEGGIRVPLIVRWPAKVQANRIIDQPVSLLGMMPTLLEMTGIDIQKTVGPVDGSSFAKIAMSKENETSANPASAIYWHIPHYTNQGSRPASAIRDGDWKLIETLDTGMVELFNIQEDPSETKNVIEQHPEAAGKLKGKLHAWRASVGAQLPTPNPRADASLHRSLYLDHDPSMIRGQATSVNAIASAWASWRQGMNQAVAGHKPVLKEIEHGIRLDASQAVTHGKRIRYEPEPYKNVVGYWTEVDDWVEWNFNIPNPGEYELQLHYGCGNGNGGSKVRLILTSDQTTANEIEMTVRETGHFQNIIIEPMGRLNLTKGVHNIQVRPISKAAAAVMDIRHVVLIPVVRKGN